MKDFLKNVLDELKILEKKSAIDYSEKKYNVYEYYVKEYNQILTKLKNNGFYESTSCIKNVPEREKATWGTCDSPAEISKHSEVCMKAQQLIKKIEDQIGSEPLTTPNNEVSALIEHPKDGEIKPKREGVTISKTCLWCIITITLTIIGGAYYLGKDIGSSKYDKEKNFYSNENTQLKKDADGLNASYTTLLEIRDSLQKKLELYEKLDGTAQK